MGIAARQGPYLLVIPARKQAVELAFDMARMRSVYLISYQQRQDASPFMHIWDASRRQWLETDAERYSAAVHFTVKPSTVFLLGTPKEFPPVLNDASTWADVVIRMDDLSPANVLNELDRHLDFSPREWRTLARRHKLTLKDHNYMRRRYGKYGPPGSEPKRPPVKIEVEQPDVPLINEPAIQPLEEKEPEATGEEQPLLILEAIEEAAPTEMPEPAIQEAPADPVPTMIESTSGTAREEAPELILNAIEEEQPEPALPQKPVQPVPAVEEKVPEPAAPPAADEVDQTVPEPEWDTGPEPVLGSGQSDDPASK